MPGQLLPLRLLNTSASFGGFSHMKHGTTLQSSRGISIFSRAFPFKLKYLGFPGKLGLPLLRNGECGVRRISSRAFRSRNGANSRGSVGRASESSRGRREERGEFQAGSFGGRVGQAKSLVEDEAELSDWVSELKTSSFQAGLNTDDSDMEYDRRSGRDTDRSSDRNSFSSRKNQRVQSDGFPPSKRQRDSNSDGSGFSKRSSHRSSGQSFSRNSRVSSSASLSKRRFASESDEDEKFPPQKSMDSDTDDFPVSKRSTSRSKANSSLRNLKGSISGSVSKKWFVSESDDGYKCRGVLSHNGNRPTCLSPVTRQKRQVIEEAKQ